MNPVVGDQAHVMAALQSTIAAFREDGPFVQSVMNASYPDLSEDQRNAKRQQVARQLQDAYNEAQARPKDGSFYMPPIQVVSLFQTAMQDHLGADLTVSQNRGLVDGGNVPLPEKFGSSDPLWIEAVLAKLDTLVRGKAPFVSHTHLSDFFYAIPENCTIALVADWGADDPSALAVARQMKNRKPDYAIHLGDIYYAGSKAEAKSFLYRFRDIAGQRSFALNGNHEMYSGGRGYFEVVLPNLQQTASYFGLFNQNWQLVALDSAYVDHVLTSPTDKRLQNQFDWAVDKLKDSARSSMVLTHHQPFSIYQPEQDNATRLREDIGRLDLAIQPASIFAWFFGHEHRCTIYDDSFNDFRARLIGNGSIPHLKQTPPTEKTGIHYTTINQGVRPDGSGYAICGFVLLTLNGPNMKVEYINEDGSLFATENWMAKAGK